MCLIILTVVLLMLVSCVITVQFAEDFDSPLYPTPVELPQTSSISTEYLSEAKIPICCAPQHFLRASKCHKDEARVPGDVTIPVVYVMPKQKSKKMFNDFIPRYGIPCMHGLYALNPNPPSLDVFYLLENSSIYQDNSRYHLPDTLLTAVDYCFANIIRAELNASTVVAACMPWRKAKTVPIIYPIMMFMSSIFLAVTLLVYSLLPELKNIHGLTLMAYVSCLFAAYAALTVVQFKPSLAHDAKGLCVALAFVIHFSFLASFFWLNVMCFDIWWTFGKNPRKVINRDNGGFRSLQGSIKQREMKKFVIYSVYAWGCAAFFTGICLVMDLVPGIPDTLIKPGFGHSNCWFSTNTARAIYFYAPMAVTIVCNISLFISTTMKILQHKKDTAHHLKGMDSHRHDDSRQWFNLYLKLFIVMGISWSMEIISWLCQGTPQYVWYVTDLANTLQGVIIFIIFVWKPKIKRLLLKRFKRDGPGFGFRASTKSAGYSSTTSRTYTSALMPLQDIKITNHNFDKNLSTTAVVTDESECL